MEKCQRRMLRPVQYQDPFPGTHFTGTPCLFLDMYKTLLGCKEDTGCVEKAVARTLKDYASYLLNDESDLKAERG